MYLLDCIKESIKEIKEEVSNSLKNLSYSLIYKSLRNPIGSMKEGIKEIKTIDSSLVNISKQ